MKTHYLPRKKTIETGSVVWYSKRKCYVKVLSYDPQGDSYTVEYQDRIIDTTSDYLVVTPPPKEENSCLTS